MPLILLVYAARKLLGFSTMAIINGNRCVTKEKIKTTISSETISKIEEYCNWANIDDVGFFIEEAASFVFSKDKDWKAYQRTNKSTKNQNKSIA